MKSSYYIVWVTTIQAYTQDCPVEACGIVVFKGVVEMIRLLFEVVKYEHD